MLLEGFGEVAHVNKPYALADGADGERMIKKKTLRFLKTAGHMKFTQGHTGEGRKLAGQMIFADTDMLGKLV